MSLNLHILPDVPKELPKSAWHFFQLIRDNFKRLKDNTKEDWIVPALLNGWDHYSAFSNYSPVAYMKDNSGIVRLRGLAAGGTLNAVLFNLPVNYRPGINMIYTVADNAGRGTVYVYSDGRVLLKSDCHQTWTSVNEITFLAEK